MKSIRCLLFILLPSCFILSCAGCNIIGMAAQALPAATVAPSYDKLAGHSVGVMVWAASGVRIDWNSIQLDVAAAVQNRLQKADPKVLPNVTFPVLPESIVRFQREHPELDGASITDIAPRLGVSRLIYVEIEQFSTRAEQSVELYRGTLIATVRVVEIENGVAKITFEENRVSAQYPAKAPREGVPGAGDYRIYGGTVTAFATEVSDRFLPHEEK